MRPWRSPIDRDTKDGRNGENGQDEENGQNGGNGGNGGVSWWQGGNGGNEVDSSINTSTKQPSEMIDEWEYRALKDLTSARGSYCA